jgi:hypothetical protein
MKGYFGCGAGRGRIWLAAAALGATWSLTGLQARATEPTPPVEIVTPEEAAEAEGVVRDQVEIRVRKDQVTGLKTRVILFQNGRELLQTALDPDFRPAPEDRAQEVEGPVIVARIPAVPQEFVSRVEPGVYANKVVVEAGLQGEGAGNYEASEWVRWRTDGKRVQLLTGERYSELTERAETAAGEAGGPVLVLQGAERVMAEPDKPVPSRIDTRVGDGGVVPERPVQLKKDELERSFDERDED